MLSDSVLKNTKFSIICILIFFTVLLSSYLIVSSQFEKTVKVSINNITIGYYESENEFDETFLQLKKELSAGYEVYNIYLEQEPVFENLYVKKSKLELQNNYTNLRSFIKTEYTLYALYIDSKKSMTFINYDTANKYYNDIKKNTVNLKIEIQECKEYEKIESTTIDRAELIKKDIVSRYKPIIIPKVSIDNQQTFYPTITKYISSNYGYRWGTIHTGIDLAGKLNDNVYAYKSGKVISSGWEDSYGNCIIIDHGYGVKTRYAHLNKLLVNVGQYVPGGQKIGLMGTTGNSTGVHLHFEYIINNKTVNPYKYIF